MLDLLRTRINVSNEVPYTGPKPASGTALIQGTAVKSLSTPISSLSAMLSTGVAANIFRGVCMTPLAAESSVAEFFDAEINADKAIIIPQTGYSLTTLSVFKKEDGAPVAVDGISSSEGVTTLDLTLAGIEGTAVSVSASRALSASEVYNNSGPSDQIIAKQEVDQVTRITSGEIYTNAYNTKVAWAPGDKVRLGAGGLFTNTGAGPIVSSVLLSVPSANDPFLGFEVNGVSNT